jgi:tRNA A-37 threonylcarbamoyl transferase component Bud32
MELTVGSIINYRYRLLEKLGEGGFAVVYKAEDLDLGRIVAIKHLKANYFSSQEDLDRFRREARILGNLTHKNIISVFAFELLSEGSAFIVMEYLEGRSLAALLLEKKRLDLHVSLPIFIQVCNALSSAQLSGIIHRDLSPSNIFLLEGVEGYKVKVIDFGLAKPASDGAGPGKLTRTGSLLGNPAYMSPETSRGEQATAASDIYSLGCVLYETLCGQPPFKADSPVSMLYYHQNCYPAEPRISSSEPEKDEAVKRIILRCLQKKPSQRFNTFAQLEAALKGESGGPEFELPAKLDSWANATVSRPAALVSGAVSVGAALAVLAALVTFQGQILAGAAAFFCSVQGDNFVAVEERFAEALAGAGKDELSLRLYDNLVGRKDGAGSLKGARLNLNCGKLSFILGKHERAVEYLSRVFCHGPVADAGMLTETAALLNQHLKVVLPTDEELILRARLLEQAVRSPGCNSSMATGILEGFIARRDLLLKQSNRMAPPICFEIIARCLPSRKLIFSSATAERVLTLSHYLSGSLYRKVSTAIVESPGIPEVEKPVIRTLLITSAFESNPSPENLRKARSSLLAFLPDVDAPAKVRIYCSLARIEAKGGQSKEGVQYLHRALDVWRAQLQDVSSLGAGFDCLSAAAQIKALPELAKQGDDLRRLLRRRLNEQLQAIAAGSGLRDDATTSMSSALASITSIHQEGAVETALSDYTGIINLCLGAGDEETVRKIVSDLREFKLKYELPLSADLLSALARGLKEGKIKSADLQGRVKSLLAEQAKEY